MTTRKIIFLIVLGLALISIIKMNNREDKVSVANAVSVDPVSHASMILNWDGKAIYTDPVGSGENFFKTPTPDLILLTDIHGDHLDLERLQDLSTDNTIIVAPETVADKLNSVQAGILVVLKNGETANHIGFKIEAIPMYNLPETEKSYHTKGRGNGYVIEKGDTRVYVSGDTSGIPEMRNLRDVDIAFVAMNLPYTMSVEEAADAVLEFKPKQVYPYHFRTPEGFSDVAKFKEIVNSQNPKIEVIQLEWYSKS